MIKLDFQLKLEQSQKLIITPELKMAIALLQYSTLELAEHIQQELMENPVLEVTEGEDKANEPENPSMEEEAPELPREDEFPWEDYLRDRGVDLASEGLNQPGRSWEGFPTVENHSSSGTSMQEDLLAQLRMLALNPREFTIASFLVGNLDGNGYLHGEMEDLARALGISQQELEKVLKIVQDLEPTGIASRCLQECLMLQLMSLKDPHPLAVEIVKKYLPAAADGRYRYIASCLNCEIAEVQQTVDFIRTLNPKPGSVFGEGDETRYLVPDIVVEKVDNEYVVIVNESITPQLNVSPFYQKLLKNGSKDEKLNAYVKGKFEKAYWLIRSIEQRRLTLYKVARQIVDIQQPFLEGGIKQLKPLTLREVAQQVGVHESTVSRATNNKYIQTPRGLFPMKFFFSSGLSSDGGEDFSSHSIKTHLKELVENEDACTPLSDQQITELLHDQGIGISRRTVAKYREELAIPASYKRRRH